MSDPKCPECNDTGTVWVTSNPYGKREALCSCRLKQVAVLSTDEYLREHSADGVVTIRHRYDPASSLLAPTPEEKREAAALAKAEEKLADMADHFANACEVGRRLEAELDRLKAAHELEKRAHERTWDLKKKMIEERDAALMETTALRVGVTSAIGLAWHQNTVCPGDKEIAAACKAMRERVEEAARVLRDVQGLADGVDQGPRAEPSAEWRIPWSRKCVEVFCRVADYLRGGA